MTTHAEDRRFARTTLVGALPASHPPAENLPSALFSAAPKGSGPPGGTAAARSPLPPAAAMYAEVLGWPVMAEADQVVVRCGDVVDVVAMPVGLAGEVNHLLKVHLLNAPVMEVRGRNPTWAFFCEPRGLPHGEHAVGMLALHRVEHFGLGASVLLPPSLTQGSAALRWVVPPPLEVPSQLPPWVALVSCALTAIRR